MTATEFSHDAIFRQVALTIADELKLIAADLSQTTDLRRLPGLESIKLLRIVSRVERHYGVELDEDAIYRATSLGDVVDAVVACLAVPGKLGLAHG